ncbi:hypothetical protein SAMN03080618_03524 [Aquamicrobium aerolatum DSM 21857]|uniref:Uncharacterized protein n=1 Tax=Aquamicrobium aerolatum DSM 21857 TaxID=1121003 RepID=A0A1I3T1X7_9HYPH|nr:hypothetical protein SAMN03080618_03524 [Aquamicrobium aerolatum DSM 21857]
MSKSNIMTEIERAARHLGVETAALAVNDRGNGTPPFRVKGTPVRACEGHAG